MADYIDRDRLIKKFCNNCYFDVGEKNCAEDCFDVKIIKSLPTEDVAPVVHGKWIIRDRKRYLISCSNCNWINVHGKFDYCPICGATMDGEA